MSTIRFESRVLPLLVRPSQRFDDLLPNLSLHVLALGARALARDLVLSEHAPDPNDVISRSREKLQVARSAWNSPDVSAFETADVPSGGGYTK